MRVGNVQPDRSLAQEMRDTSQRIAPAATDEPFVANGFIPLDQASKKPLNSGCPSTIGSKSSALPTMTSLRTIA